MENMHLASPPNRSKLQILFVLCWVFSAAKAQGDTSVPPLPVAESASAPERSVDGAGLRDEKNYALPAEEIIGFDILLNRFNRAFRGSSDYKVTLASIRRNLRGPWVVDDDPFQVNQLGHPVQGSIHFSAARSSGLSYWESASYAVLGSVSWEIAGEQAPPSRNDVVASGAAGSFFGETVFRMAHLVLNGSGDVPYAWREWGAAIISPATGFNRLLYGSRFDSFDDHDPVTYSRLRIGGNVIHRAYADSPTSVKQSDAEIDYSLDYGLPGDPRYSYTRPFDNFSFRAAASSASAVELLTVRGLLLGTEYAIGDKVHGLWGLYSSYDYMAPKIFNFSTTGLAIGTVGQWTPTSNIAVQGTGLVGIGYAAGSNANGVQDSRDYHYGAVPQVDLGLRFIAGQVASLDVMANHYFLERLADSSASHDDISRIETALTWRVTRQQAIAIKYVWSNRNVTYPGTGDRSQTLRTVGAYYTLLGADGFGTVNESGVRSH